MQEFHIKIFIHKAWAGQTVQDLFKQTWQAPKKLVHQLRMDKTVYLNNKMANWTEPLKTGDQINIVIKNIERDLPSANIPIDILYEDEHLLIVNKPAGMATHPNKDEKDTLLNAVSHHLKGNYVHHIHRLDKETTGTVLFAKHPLSQAILDRMLEIRTLKRTYWALADGLLTKKSGTINHPIGRDRHHPTRRRVSATGQAAITDYKVLREFPHDRLTLVECTLRTGRTHQIRVHFKHIGHPLSGDKLYGGSSRFARQALHSRKLEFIHPFSLEHILVKAPFLDVPPIFDPFITLFE